MEGGNEEKTKRRTVGGTGVFRKEHKVAETGGGAIVATMLRLLEGGAGRRGGVAATRPAAPPSRTIGPGTTLSLQRGAALSPRPRLAGRGGARGGADRSPGGPALPELIIHHMRSPTA